MLKKIWLLLISIFVFCTPSFATTTVLEQGYSKVLPALDNVVGWKSKDDSIAAVTYDEESASWKVVARKLKGGYVDIVPINSDGNEGTNIQNYFVYNAKLTAQCYSYKTNSSKDSQKFKVVYGNNKSEGRMYFYLDRPEEDNSNSSLKCYKILSYYGGRVEANANAKGKYLCQGNGFGAKRNNWWSFSAYYLNPPAKEDDITSTIIEPDYNSENKELNAFNVSIEQLDNGNIRLKGTYYQTKDLDTESSELIQVFYQDENGKEREALRNKEESTYYDSETKEEVNIIFSNDMSEDSSGGYLATSSEAPLEVTDGTYTFIAHDVTIIFPVEVGYKGNMVKEISIEGQKLEAESYDERELISDWETDEIEKPTINAYLTDSSGRKYLPITVSSGSKSILLKYYFENSQVSTISLTEPVGKTWDEISWEYMTYIKDYLPSGCVTPVKGEKLINFSVNMPSDYSEDKLYYAGDQIQIKGTSCKHSLDTIQTKLVEEEITKYGEWTAYASYMKGSHTYSKKTLNGGIPSDIDYETKATTKYDHKCSNGYKQYKVTKYYREIIKETIYVERKSSLAHVGELSCPVDIAFSGFRVNGGLKSVHVKNGKVYVKYDDAYSVALPETTNGYLELVTDFTQGSESNWAKVFKIDDFANDLTALKERKYDSSKGLYYGTIKVTCDDNQSYEYKIYFGPLPSGEYSVSYMTDPAEGGIVPNYRNFSSTQIDSGVTFPLWVNANDGYEFEKWQLNISYPDGTVENRETTSTADYKMPKANVIATAVFASVTPTPIPPSKDKVVEVIIIGNGTVTANGTEIKTGDTIVTKKADTISFISTPEDYWTFTKYSSDKEEELSKDNVYDHIVGDETVIYVHFDDNKLEPEKFGIKFVADPEEGGRVPASIEDIPENTLIAIPKELTPNAGWKFSNWDVKDENGNTIAVNQDEVSLEFTVLNNIIATANFVKDTNDNRPDRVIKIEIIGEGTVTVNDDEVESGGTVTGKDGDELPVKSTPDEGWIFVRYTDEDGNELSTDPDYIYTVDGDNTIIAVFEQIGPYTLYVTSLYGGDAWIEEILSKPTDFSSNPSEKAYTIKKIGPDSLGKCIYKVSNVFAGSRFVIKYSVDSDYVFDAWEYRPVVNGTESGKTVEIIMPSSNLTVTATFINDDVKDKPQLSVTTNNPEWGTAYTIIDGEKTRVDEKYDGVIGKEYKVYYEAKDGYYFINWEYSTTQTPFTDEDTIIMPPTDLEAMAMFAPIPPKGEGGHRITFEAEPPEGGKVPDDSDLVNILPGGKVTIGVTVNYGWEFDYWKFEDEDGNRVYPTVEYDPNTGTGYFIMPNYDVTAIAVFKEKEHYKLYVTHEYGGDAWTLDKGEKTTYIEKAYVGYRYPIYYKVEDSNYDFTKWEFRWNKYGLDMSSSDIIPDEFVDKGYAVMPRSDMTVTAAFNEKTPTDKPILMVSTNNELWGDAWVVVGDNDYHSEWVELEAGKEYEVYYMPKEGYEFTNWSTEEYFTEYKDNVYRAVLKMPSEKLELMAFFKPGKDSENKFNLGVSSDPKGSGKVWVNNNKNTTELDDISAGTEIVVHARDNDSYTFKYWYRVEEGAKVRVSDSEDYKFTMPSKDYELFAFFKKNGQEDSGDVDGKAYQLAVSVSPASVGVAKIKKYSSTSIEAISGENYTVVATLTQTGVIEMSGKKYEYKFSGWYEGTSKVSDNLSYEFRMPNRDRNLVAKFEPKLINSSEDNGGGSNNDLFRIVSVRDLNWKDYFTDSKGNLTGNYFTVPNKDTTMLQSLNGISKTIKMGYAVEFELDTYTVPFENAYLKITPQIINGKTVYNSSNSETIFDDLTGKRLESYFLNPIVIYANPGNDPNKSSNAAYTSFMATAEEKYAVYGKDNVNQHKITWRWLYYLPAKIDGTKFTDDEKVTIRFNVELYENQGNTKSWDAVTYYNKGQGLQWQGNVYEYSLKDSLLDDIYNNATN